MLASNIIFNIDLLKKLLGKEYEIKDFGKVKTIIGWQITKNTVAGTRKIDQSAFIRDFVIKECLMDYNINIILKKICSIIEITGSKDYKETKL